MIKQIIFILITCITVTLQANPLSIRDSIVDFKIIEENRGNHDLYFFSFNNAVYDLSISCLPLVNTSFHVGFSPSDIISNIKIIDKRELTLTERNLFFKNKCNLINYNNPIINSFAERKRPVIQVIFNPFIIEGNTVFLVTKYEVSISFKENNSLKQLKKNYANSSVLSSGIWYKIRVKNNGIHKIDYSFLQSIGVNPQSINPRNIKIFGNGGGMLPQANNIDRLDDLW